MDLVPPTSYRRRILLAVTGFSPQVVTETLYALAIGREDPFIPTEIHVITTSEGAQRIRLSLFSDRPGWFYRLLDDYRLPGITFGTDNIHVMKDPAGREMPDIRTPAENLACADFITELVRGFSSDPDCALHVSIAGGRKTMGFFLGYSLSLYGRPQDRLSHVLISEPFESSWDFFYPTPYERIIETAGKKLADARDAKVDLAEIPFVSLRHGLPTALLDGSARYNETVSAAQAALSPAYLELDLTNRTVRAASRTFRLPPAELAMLAVFARRVIAQQAALPAPPKEVPDSEWKERYLRELRIICGPLGERDTTTHSLERGMDGHYFSMRLSKLRTRLKRELGVAAAPYLVDDGGRKPHRYRLALEPSAVCILDGASLPTRSTAGQSSTL